MEKWKKVKQKIANYFFLFRIEKETAAIRPMKNLFGSRLQLFLTKISFDYRSSSN